MASELLHRHSHESLSLASTTTTTAATVPAIPLAASSTSASTINVTASSKHPPAVTNSLLSSPVPLPVLAHTTAQRYSGPPSLLRQCCIGSLLILLAVIITLAVQAFLLPLLLPMLPSAIADNLRPTAPASAAPPIATPTVSSTEQQPSAGIRSFPVPLHFQRSLYFAVVSCAMCLSAQKNSVPKLLLWFLPKFVSGKVYCSDIGIVLRGIVSLIFV